ncbi:hypothetical protein N665_0067s0016 [Sinapis alba]|nr:hypothetical protein N665_0067s0016 [Sinapis alba]
MPNPTGSNIISFKERAMADQVKLRNDLFVVELTIQNINVARILVDTRSSADIIFKRTLERMEIDLSRITEDPSPLLGISGEATMTLETINLMVGDESITRIVEFLVVDRPSSYNAIVGTPWISSMQTVPSTYHLCLKFPTPHGIETIWGNRKILQVCFIAELKRKVSSSKTPSNKKRKSFIDKNALGPNIT